MSLSYAVSSLFLLITIIIHFLAFNGSFSRSKNKTFLSLLLCTLLANICLAIYTFVLTKLTTPIPVLELITLCLYNVFYIVSSSLYCVVIISSTKNTGTYNIFDIVISIVPSMAAIILIATSSYTNLFFAIDSATGHYVRGPYSHMIYAIALFYYILTLFYTIKYWKAISLTVTIALTIFTLVAMGAAFFELKTKIYIAEMFYVIALLIMYITLLNPYEYKDTETGAFNKHAFQKNTYLNIRAKKKFTIIGIGIKNYDFISSHYGYEKAGKVLSDVKKILDTVSDKNVYYFLDGKFAIEIFEKDISKALNQLKEYFSKGYELTPFTIPFSTIICAVSYPRHMKTVEGCVSLMDYVFENEDVANFNNEPIIMSEEIVSKQKRYTAVEHIVNEAIKNKSFEVYYQPIINVQTGKFETAEALVRLKDPNFGFISPGEFIPISEYNGSIIAIGEIVFEKVCQFISETDMAALGLKYIEVNLSVIQCLREGLSQKLIDIMKQYQVNPAMINFEITESVCSETQNNIINNNINRLIENGSTISMDDFGTGFSNLMSISRFPFRIIKLDKSFVEMLTKDYKSRVISETALKMIFNLNCKVLAEGVESKTQAYILKDYGVDFIQGFLYSKPIPKDEFIQFIKDNYKN